MLPTSFSESSARRHWIFDPDHYWEIQQIASARISGLIDLINRNFSKQGSSQSQTQAQTPIIPFTTEEEQDVIQFYLCEMQVLFKTLRRGTVATLSTALVLFRRYYLHHSVMEYDPRLMMLASFLLAGKVEETYIDPQELSKIAQVGIAYIIAAEKALLSGIMMEVSMKAVFCRTTMLWFSPFWLFLL